MEMKLIEVALALVTIYLMMALGATQIGEMYSAYTASRSKVLLAVMEEIFHDRPGLINRFFNYAPIYSLSEGQRKPSAIPPNLFATSFLAVLNNNKPPRSDFRTPAEFVASTNQGSDHLTQLLVEMVAGTETDWDEFEHRIARWYKDVCDRSEGWFKRNNAVQLLWISLGLTLLFNADSFLIARTLMESDGLRVSVANIGELIASQGANNKNQNGAAAIPAEKLTSAAAATSPFVVSGHLDKALGEMREAANLVPQLMGFGNDKGEIAKTCNGDTSPKKNELFDSNYEAWTHLMAGIVGKVEAASLGISEQDTQDAPNAKTRTANIRKAMVCTTAIAKWVHAAQYTTKNKDATAHLKEASAALERAREQMLSMTVRFSVQSNLVKSYAVLGQDFADCASGAGSSRAKFEQCLAENSSNALPFGWPGRAGQFCKVTLEAPNGPALPAAPLPAAKAEADRGGSWWGCADFKGSPDLELPPIFAHFELPKLFGAVVGWLITAILVSLGAPFWFGLLGKVAQLRMAGRVRGLEESPRGSTISETPEAGMPPARAPAPEQPNPNGPFDSARNEFERALQPQEISRLQIVLDLPPTMTLDEITRNAIAARLTALGQPADRELSAPTYLLIVGRNTAQIAADVPSAAVWPIGTREPEMVRKLIGALNTLFPTPDWKPLPDEVVFDHALRARVVLYRFKSDPNNLPRMKQVVTLANSARNELLRLDEPTRRAILADAGMARKFARDPNPWLDFAYGELGVRENEEADAATIRATEYLRSMSPDQSMTPTNTSWCGAFVGWVLKQAGLLDPNTLQPALLTAANWTQFGQQGDGKPGELCLVDFGSGIHHVAFLIEIDALGRHWLLGGNQGDTGVGGVTLIPFSSLKNKYTFRKVR